MSNTFIIYNPQHLKSMKNYEMDHLFPTLCQGDECKENVEISNQFSRKNPSYLTTITLSPFHASHHVSMCIPLQYIELTKQLKTHPPFNCLQMKDMITEKAMHITNFLLHHISRT